MVHPLPEFGPSEDLLLRILRGYFYGDPFALTKPDGVDVPEVGTLMPDDWVFPFVLARRDRRSGAQTVSVSDETQMQAVVVTIETFCQGVEGDRDNSLLQAACHHALFSAQRQQMGWPDLGYLNKVSVWSQPARVSDYATSTGVVQYASLPQNVVRYESILQLTLRPVEAGQTVNRFLHLE